MLQTRKTLIRKKKGGCDKFKGECNPSIKTSKTLVRDFMKNFKDIELIESDISDENFILEKTKKKILK